MTHSVHDDPLGSLKLHLHISINITYSIHLTEDEEQGSSHI